MKEYEKVFKKGGYYVNIIIYDDSEKDRARLKKLNEIEEELKEYGFLRIHQSFLVNMRYIQKISSYVLTLKNGKELSVPKSRYQEVKRKYANHLDLSRKVE